MTGIWRAVRWPIVAVVITAALVVAAFTLDAGPAWARETALLIGVPALYFLLPGAVIWLLIAAVLHGRHGG